MQHHHLRPCILTFLRLLVIGLLIKLLLSYLRGYFNSEQVFIINVISGSESTSGQSVEALVRRALGTRHVSDHIDLAKKSIRFNWAIQNLLEVPPVALIVVSSTPEQKFRRMAIRQSWANWTEEQHVKIIFYIGLPADGDLRGLAFESALYDDLIVDEFQDTFYSSSLKTLRIFKWFLDFYSTSSSKPPYLVKADDDVFIHVPNLVSHLRSLNDSVLPYMGGALHVRATVTRRKSSKFFVPRDLWPDRHYPPYLSGPCYILSTDLVHQVFLASFKVPLFHLEDVYITGMVANQTLGVKLAGLPADVMVEKASILSRAIQFRTNVWKAIAYHGVVDGGMMKHLYRVANLHD